MQSVSAELINERAEQECYDLGNGTINCLFIGYGSNVFERDENGNLVTFKQMIRKAELDENKNIVFEFRNDNNVTFKPFGILRNGNKVFMEDLTPQQRQDLNFSIIKNSSRDDYKFGLTFNKINNLDYIGLKLESNLPVTPIVYNYTPEGIYDDTNFTQYELIDIVIKNRRITFRDLVEYGFNVSFNKTEKEVMIDLRDKEGFIIVDPSVVYTLDANDGHISLVGGSCVNVNDTLTTATMGEDYRTADHFETNSYISVNTSIIPDDATIEFFRIRTYAHSYSKTAHLPITWSILYRRSVDDSDLGDLGCSDVVKFSGGNSMGTLNWAGTTGYKIKGNAVNNVNVTGWTNVRMEETWAVNSGEHALVDWRTSEYGSTLPSYYINYTVPSAEEQIILISKQSVYPFIAIFGILFVGGVLNAKKK